MLFKKFLMTDEHFLYSRFQRDYMNEVINITCLYPSLMCIRNISCAFIKSTYALTHN